MLIAFAEYLSHASPFVTLGILVLALRRIESNLV